MAYEEALRSITLPASGDLSASQYKAVDLSTAGQIETLSTAAGDFAIGILQDDPENAGEAAEVGIGGVTKVHMNGGSNAISPGTPLQVSTASIMIAGAAVGDYILGRSLDAVSTGSTGIYSMLITHEGQLSS